MMCALFLSIGPDGNRYFRRAVVDWPSNTQYVGIGTQTKERTSDVAHLWRPPTGMKFPLAKNGRITEIGGAVEYFGIIKGLWTLWYAQFYLFMLWKLYLLTKVPDYARINVLWRYNVSVQCTQICASSFSLTSNSYLSEFQNT